MVCLYCASDLGTTCTCACQYTHLRAPYFDSDVQHDALLRHACLCCVYLSNIAASAECTLTYHTVTYDSEKTTAKEPLGRAAHRAVLQLAGAGTILIHLLAVIIYDSVNV